MGQLSFAASGLVMGGLLVAIGVTATRRRGTDRPVRTDGGQPATGRMQRVAGDPLVWSLAFLLLVAAGVGGTLLVVTGMALPIVPSGFGTLLVGLLAGAVLVYLCWGFYHAARYRGLHRPAALAVAAWVAGLLFVLGIVFRLLEIV
ncbi:hypothetical protein ACFR9U_13710 [Halorientalis brevis]|uniref:Uncharacterized protein n=1 Tax=Halorientalis brevis TaxID=1126241 RepID=A0ABD6CF63_9EURY|nr:hypothetical protein [Halorientalis brevis]